MHPYLTVFSIRIPMYGLMMAIGFLLCSVICFLRTRKRGLQGENLIIIAAMILLFALSGGFVFYALVTYRRGPHGEITWVPRGNHVGPTGKSRGSHPEITWAQIGRAHV